MDLKAYYQRIRELERGFGSEAVVLVSLDTPDGGKAGVLTEAPAHVAARMIVGGRARAATAEESAEFRKRTGEAQRAASEREPARRIQVTKK
jgi:sRNA-binding protein